jgi:hypothetical protein
MKIDVGIWAQRDSKSENSMGFARSRTYDLGTNLLLGQKFQAEP